ncbi:MAG: hypothetical protein ACXAD7_21425, partial [Candidatus Kariarchaeaceae archaeon]
MARRPFIRRKKNEIKNQEAVDVFREFNILAPSSREKYLNFVNTFADFLLIHKKSLWDADFKDLKKFLIQTENKSARSIISTFYRVLIDSGEYKRDNPVVQLNKTEREAAQSEALAVQPISQAEAVIQQLSDPDDIPVTQKKAKRKRRERVTKRIMILSDLER